MDDEKPDADWEEAERLGPYQIHEQVPRAAHHRGELFRATHRTSGATALVLKLPEKSMEPPPDWQVRCISSSSPSYLSMEVEHSPWSFASNRHSMEELIFMFEGLHEGVRRMAHDVPYAHEQRSERRLGSALVGAVVCVLVVALVQLFRVFAAPVGPTPLMDAAPAPMSSEVATDIEAPMSGNSLMGALDGGPGGLSHPFPRQPYKGQKRPPCNPRVEVEIQGGCWVPHKLKAPCPEELYEYKGECYTAAFIPQPTPRSLGQ